MPGGRASTCPRLCVFSRTSSAKSGRQRRLDHQHRHHHQHHRRHYQHQHRHRSGSRRQTPERLLCPRRSIRIGMVGRYLTTFGSSGARPLKGFGSRTTTRVLGSCQTPAARAQRVADGRRTVILRQPSGGVTRTIASCSSRLRLELFVFHSSKSPWREANACLCRRHGKDGSILRVCVWVKKSWRDNLASVASLKYFGGLSISRMACVADRFHRRVHDIDYLSDSFVCRSYFFSWELPSFSAVSHVQPWLPVSMLRRLGHQGGEVRRWHQAPNNSFQKALMVSVPAKVHAIPPT